MLILLAEIFLILYPPLENSTTHIASEGILSKVVGGLKTEDMTYLFAITM